MELISRHSKWVKVAVTRNANAVGALRIMVMRKKRGESLFKTRLVGKYEAKRLSETAGNIARKNLSANNDYEEVTDDKHPLVRLLETVNPNSNWFELCHSTVVGLDLTGNAYWALVKRGGNVPVELWNLPPQYVKPVPNQDGTLDGYLYGRVGQEIRLAPQDVIQFKKPNPFGDPWSGLADLLGCVNEADLSTKLTMFATSMLDNGATPGGVIKLPGASPDQLTQVREEFEGKYANPTNAGRWVALGNKDADVVPFGGDTQKNPVLMEAENHSRAVIAACFDMPVGMLNMEEKSLANGKVVAPHWQLMAIKPRAQIIEDKLNEALVPMFRDVLGDDSLCIVIENPVVEEQQLLIAELQAGLAGQPWLTKNEARAKAGLDPVEGGDDFPDPMAMLGGGAFGEGKPDKPKDEKPEAQDSGATGDKAIKSQMQALMETPVTVTKDKTNQVTATQEELEKVLSEAYRAMIPAYADAVTTLGIHLAPQARSGFVNMVDMLTRDALLAAMAQGYTQGVEAGKPIDMANLRASDFLNSYRMQFADTAVQAFEWRIRSQLQTGLRESVTVPEMANRIREVMPVMSMNAAAVIARTETARALNAGKELAWSESETVIGKEWLLSGNPCKICRAVWQNSRFAKLGEPFVRKGSVVAGTVLDYADINGGDAHPNCSCGIGVVRKQ